MATHALAARPNRIRATLHTITWLAAVMLATLIVMIAVVDNTVPATITTEFDAIEIRLMWTFAVTVLAGITLGGLHRPAPGRHRR